ncbi:MAG: glycosyltransferase family 4 protein [Endomicrobia bacterium]|nr:glycosyltransferase family 4 protein [Bacillota bacterium]MCL1972673.1 glycosyltransferase family 4 protein [Endomicrobiia bacterium]
MIKVCHIITKLELGGAQRNTLFTVANLNHDKYNAFLISGSGGILDGEAEKDLKLYSVKSLIRRISPLNDFKAFISIYRIIKLEKPDIVHTHSSKAGILGRIAAKLAGVKVIIHTIHGFGFNNTQSMPVKYLYIYLEKICAWFTDKLIAVAKEDVVKGLNNAIGKSVQYTVIRSGIDTQYYKNYKPDPEFRKTLGLTQSMKAVLSIGPFKPQKNFKDFIMAAEIVCKERDDVLFFIAGDGGMRKELEDLIAGLGLQKKTVLLGWRKDIAELLYASDIFVLTSLWEGLPRSGVEAMCCAKPVIANAVDGVKELVVDGKNGYKTAPYDYKNTAEKITLLLEDDNARISMGKAAKESIGKEFDINYMVIQQEELYEQLITNYE